LVGLRLGLTLQLVGLIKGRMLSVPVAPKACSMAAYWGNRKAETTVDLRAGPWAVRWDNARADLLDYLMAV
jgi:hypothetical protein